MDNSTRRNKKSPNTRRSTPQVSEPEPDLDELREIMRGHLNRTRRSLFALPLIAILGLSFLAVSTKLWLVDNQMDLLSSAGIGLGVLLGGVFVFGLAPTVALPYRYIGTKDYSEERVFGYFRELAEIDRRPNRRWHVNVFRAGVVLFVLCQIYPPLSQISIMILLVGTGLAVLGLAAVHGVEWLKAMRKNSSSNGA